MKPLWKVITLTAAMVISGILTASANWLIPQANEQVTVKLVLGPNATLPGYTASDDETIFHENVVTYTAAAESTLPTPQKSGTTFVSWVYAEGSQLVRVSKMPKTSGAVYYAYWQGDGTLATSLISSSNTNSSSETSSSLPPSSSESNVTSFYLKAKNGTVNWPDAGAKIYIYYWEVANNPPFPGVEMTNIGNDTYRYNFDFVPSKLLFVRLNPTNLSKWDQTVDLTYVAPANLFTLTSWDNGIWSNYNESQPSSSSISSSEPTSSSIDVSSSSDIISSSSVASSSAPESSSILESSSSETSSSTLSSEESSSSTTPPPTPIWYLKGVIGYGDDTLTEWNLSKPEWALIETQISGTYEITIDLYINNEFKIYQDTDPTDLWLGNSNLGTYTINHFAGSDNIKVLAHGRYKIELVDGVTDTINLTRLGNSTFVPNVTGFDRHIFVGTFPNLTWNNTSTDLELTYQQTLGQYTFTNLTLTDQMVFRVTKLNEWVDYIGFYSIVNVPTGFVFSGSDNNIAIQASGAGTYDVVLYFDGATAKLLFTQPI